MGAVDPGVEDPDEDALSPALTVRAWSDFTIARPQASGSSGSIPAVDPPWRGPPGSPSWSASTSGSPALTGWASGIRPIGRWLVAP